MWLFWQHPPTSHQKVWPDAWSHTKHRRRKCKSPLTVTRQCSDATVLRVIKCGSEPRSPLSVPKANRFYSH
jgi:hypothetical protein